MFNLPTASGTSALSRLQLGDAGVLGPGGWRWLRSLLWALLLSAVTFFFFFASQALPDWLHLPDGFFYLSALGLPLLAFWLYAHVVRVAEHRPAVEVLFPATALRDLALGALIGASMIMTTLGLLWALGLYHVELHRWQRWYASFVFDSYVSGLLEELLFRAILLRLLARAFGLSWGLVLSSLLFGAAHLGHATLLQVSEIAFNGGLMMGLLYMGTGRLWMSVGMHIAWDFTEESILGVNSHSGLLLSTPVATRSALLTGGAFGPDGSLLAGLIGLLFLACTVWFFLNRAPKQPGEA